MFLLLLFCSESASQASNISDPRFHTLADRSAPAPSLMTHPRGFRVSPLSGATSPRCPHVRFSDREDGHRNAADSPFSVHRLCHTQGLAGFVTLCFMWKTQLPGYFLRPRSTFCVSLCGVKIFLKPPVAGDDAEMRPRLFSLYVSRCFLKSTGVSKRKVGEGWGSRGAEGTFPLLFWSSVPRPSRYFNILDIKLAFAINANITQWFILSKWLLVSFDILF